MLRWNGDARTATTAGVIATATDGISVDCGRESVLLSCTRATGYLHVPPTPPVTVSRCCSWTRCRLQSAASSAVRAEAKVGTRVGHVAVFEPPLYSARHCRYAQPLGAAHSAAIPPRSHPAPQAVDSTAHRPIARSYDTCA